MVFSSITFLFYFLPIVLVIYYLVPFKAKNIILMISSLVFYFYGEPIYTLLMIFSIIYSYIFGLLIDKYRNKSKIFLISFLSISLGMLIYFIFIKDTLSLGENRNSTKLGKASLSADDFQRSFIKYKILVNIPTSLK